MKRIGLNILIILLLIEGPELSGQVNTLYYMDGIPQSYFLNPATQPQCNIFIGVPVASSQYYNFYNSSIRLDDMFWNDAASGEVLHAFHPDADVADFIAGFDDENYLTGDLFVNLLSFGFRVREMYFALDISSRTKERITYPDELIEFIVNGNENGETYDFSALKMDGVEYMEYGITVSRRFGDQLTVGIRPKLLAGVATMKWDDSNMELYTSWEEWTLNSDLNIHISAPGMTIPTDADGVIDFEQDFGFDSAFNSFSDYKKVALGNLGMGVDLGVHYNPIEELQISAGLIDLGYIKWKNHSYNVSLNGSYSYTGIALNPGDTSLNYDILDSITSSLEFTASPESFRTTLEPKVFLSARYFFIPQFDAGFVSRYEFREEGFRFNLTLLANVRPSSMFSLTGSYTPVGGNASSFGLGFSLNLGPFNVYFVSDYLTGKYNLVEKVPLLDNMNRYTFRYGVNLVFGYNQRKKLRKDKPMYYSDEY
jgi:hypothetical protein